MSEPKTITIDDTKYVRASDVPAVAGPPTPLRIVVADRGWVFVGYATEDDGGNLTLTAAKVIRYWGTDEKHPGLGYLAAHGPTAKTELDAAGTVRVPASSVVASFDVTGGDWA